MSQKVYDDVQEEARELSTKIYNLQQFMNKPEFHTTIGTVQRYLLRKQLVSMLEYRDILRVRLADIYSRLKD